MRKYILLVISGLLGIQSFAQTAREVGVELLATLTADSSLQLSWLQQSGSTRYQVYQKGADDKSWDRIGDLSGSDTLFVDTTYVFGTRKEYKVARTSSNYTGFDGNGYMIAGFGVPATTNLENVILVIEDKYKQNSAKEIAAYLSQLEREGYHLDTMYVSTNAKVTTIRDSIYQHYLRFKNKQKTIIFLLGRVPVPYSGNFRPDGHLDHTGAWPADLYYGAFDIVFTDATVNNTQATYGRNHNVPNDGKFDVSRYNITSKTLTEYVTLPVGRVDLSNMPAFGSDTLLLQQYLAKAMAFRTGERKPNLASLVDDNFGYFNSEAFASGGFRNASTFSGRNIVTSDYRTEMSKNSYLFSYGCGAGSYTSCAGVSTTSDYVNDSLLNPVTLYFGSYFGDWDNTNNFLRASLASKGWGLASAWSGRPYWMIHPCAHGAPLAEAALITKNTWGIYNAAGIQAGVHVALMGDPTLRMFHVDNVKDFDVHVSCDGTLRLNIGAIADIADSVVIEKIVNNEWQQLNVTDAKDTMTDDIYLGSGKHQLSIRYLKLLQSASGTWWQYGARHEFNLNIDTSAPRYPIAGNTKGIYCLDSMVVFYDSGFFTNPVKNVWTWNDTTVNTQFGDQVYIRAQQGQKVYLTRIAENGCEFRDSVVFELEDIRYRLHADFKSQFCLNTDYTFKDSGFANSRITNNWKFQDRMISKGTNDTFTVSSMLSGNYRLYLNRISTVGCVLNDSFDLYFNSPEKPVIDVIENMGRLGDTIKLTTNNAAPFYTWNNTTGTSNNFEFIAEKEQEKVVLQLKDTSGCTSDTTILNLSFVPNNMETISGKYQISAYPNPFQDYIELKGPIEQIQSLRMMDNSGKVVLELNSTSDLHKIPLKQLSAGAYQLELKLTNNKVPIYINLMK